MSERTGMQDLIDRTRRLVDASGTAVWTDQQIQDVLDQHKTRIYREPLSAEMTLTSGTSYVYKVYHSRYGDYEQGTAYFQVEDSAGAQRGTADYSVDYISGVVTMGTDQAGTALYLSGWTYDLNGAAADLWRERMSIVSSYYSVNVDGHQLNRAQWFDHCQQLADYYDRRSRPVVVRSWVNGVFERE